MKLACWNFRTMLDTTGSDRPERHFALIAHELSRQNINVAGLSEVRFPDEGSLQEQGTGYTLFWPGKPATERRLLGVGVMVTTSIAFNLQNLPRGHTDRIKAMRPPPKKATRYAF